MNISGGKEIQQPEVSGRHLRMVLTTNVSTRRVAEFLKLTVVWGKEGTGLSPQRPDAGDGAGGSCFWRAGLS
jgi:hypothetical protein